MRRRLLSWLIVLATATASPGAGQEPPEAEPGAIVTVTLLPPSGLTESRDEEGRLTLAYAIETAAGVRSIGRRSGRFSWDEGEGVLFPVTLRIPDRAEAGETEIAVVAFESLTGETASLGVRVRVRAIRELDLHIVSGVETAERGDRVPVTWSLANLGNAGDSVFLSLETNLGERPDGIPRAVWLAPFEEKAGTFEVAVPPEGVGGGEAQELYVRMSARVEDQASSDHLRVPVLPDRGLFPELVQIPSTVFLGSSLTSVDGRRQTEPVVAASGRGKLGRETELLFNYRYLPPGGSVFAFRGLLSGPRLFLGVENPSWDAAVGDLTARTSDLLGFQLQGRGGQAGARARGWSLRGMAARPTGLDGGTLDGHVAAAELGFERGQARGGLLGASTERADASGAPESSVRAALGRFQVDRTRHWLGIDAGPMQVANLRTGESQTSPAVDARYTYRGESADVDVLYRKLPDLMSDPRLPPSEMRAVGAVRPTRLLALSGALYDEAAPRSLGLLGTRARGARAGIRWNEPTWTVGLSGNWRRVQGQVDEHRRTARLDATVRSGDFTFDGTLGLGTATVGDDTELAELYRIGGSWLTERGMATFHVTVSDDVLQPASTLLDAYGVYRMSEQVELYASATTFVVLESEGFAPRSISDGLTVQTGARLRLAPNRFVFAGIERFSPRGSSDASWRLSVGIQQGLPVPLPLRRPPVASGLVFEDLDADGVRDDGEPGLDGVILRMGFERTSSRPGGRFEFRDAAPGTIEIDPASLGGDFVPLPPTRLPASGFAEIGLYRAGTVLVTLFLDADADGVWDDTEVPASEVTVTLSRDGESWVLRTGQDGSVSLSSVPPGTYVIRVDPESLPSRALPADLHSTAVRGGETVRLQIPVPMRQVNFSRFGGGEACTPATPACDD